METGYSYLQYGALGVLALVLAGIGTFIGLAAKSFLEEFKANNTFLRTQVLTSNEQVLSSNAKVEQMLGKLDQTIILTAQTMTTVSETLARHDDRSVEAVQSIMTMLARINGASSLRKKGE